MRSLERRMSLVGFSFLLLMAVSGRSRASVPPLPHAFYGSVESNGVPAVAGTQVEGQGAGVVVHIAGNPVTVTVPGQYGGPGGFDPKLIAQGEIAGGTPIAFYVNGVRAECALPGGPWEDSFTFVSGSLTELNLRASAIPATARLYVPFIFGSTGGIDQ